MMPCREQHSPLSYCSKQLVILLDLHQFRRQWTSPPSPPAHARVELPSMDATTAAEEERLLKNILTQAKVDSDESVKKLLSQSHIRASDLLAEPEQRAEVMLQKAGLLVGDVYKIVRVLQTFQNDPASSQGKLARAARGQPTMRCGLIVYSTTVRGSALTPLPCGSRRRVWWPVGATEQLTLRSFSSGFALTGCTPRRQLYPP
eukprot:scaffold29538_cov120-Isochrysis_galbana.AAC.10